MDPSGIARRLGSSVGRRSARGESHSSGEVPDRPNPVSDANGGSVRRGPDVWRGANVFTHIGEHGMSRDEPDPDVGDGR